MDKNKINHYSTLNKVFISSIDMYLLIVNKNVDPDYVLHL